MTKKAFSRFKTICILLKLQSNHRQQQHKKGSHLDLTETVCTLSLIRTSSNICQSIRDSSEISTYNSYTTVNIIHSLQAVHCFSFVYFYHFLFHSSFLIEVIVVRQFFSVDPYVFLSRTSVII